MRVPLEIARAPLIALHRRQHRFDLEIEEPVDPADRGAPVAFHLLVVHVDEAASLDIVAPRRPPRAPPLTRPAAQTYNPRQPQVQGAAPGPATPHRGGGSGGCAPR